MDKGKDRFEYHYSSKEQEEIRKIREKYLAPEENRLEQLRKLDAGAAKPGFIVSIIVGTLGTLLLGVGMCCTMVWAEHFFVLGIVIGLAGIAGVIAACPLYKWITKKQREKLAPEILRLTEELSRE